MTALPPRIRFSIEDLLLFSQASGDLNPLHLSAGYAVRSAYGQQVVFGALGAIAALGQMPIPTNVGVQKLVACFYRPILLDVDYELRVSERDGQHESRLFDGSVPILSLSIKTGAQKLNTTASPRGMFKKQESVEWQPDQLHDELAVSGTYSPVAAACARLLNRFGATGNSNIIEYLCWASYFVGMELPGKAALFSKLEIEFTGLTGTPGVPIDYDAIVKTFNNRLDVLTVDINLLSDSQPIAKAVCRSFVRRSLTPAGTAEIARLLPPSKSLEGKVVVVIGAGRGLGSSIASAIASQGATVIAVSRTLPDPKPSRSNDSDIWWRCGDAADIQWLKELQNEIVSSFGHIDVLICNACPPPMPLRLEAAMHDRILQFMHRSVELVLAPACVFLPQLNEAAGSIVIVSSAYVENPPADFPQYVAAKAAVESIARTAVIQYPQISALIVRPPKLLTDMVNTPIGRVGAIPPEQVAVQIAERLRSPFRAGIVDVLT